MEILKGLAQILSNFFVGSINLLIDTICLIIDALLSILPKSPFKVEPLDWGMFGDFVGIFLPAKDMVVHFVALTVCLGVYYAGRYLLRLIKMVG